MFRLRMFVHFFSSIMIILSFCTFLNSQWIENTNLGVNNLSFNTGQPFIFLQIPNSPLIIFYTGSNIMTIEIKGAKVRDGLSLTHNLSAASVIPDPDSGWNVYYKNGEKFGKLHIDPQGFFTEQKWLTKTSEHIALYSVGITERMEVWFFAEKILRLNGFDESWTEFEYPQGWDSDFSFSKIYPVYAYSSIIGIAKGNTIQDYQAFILDVETGEAKLIKAEDGLFKAVNDIDEWKEHSGYFLILKRKEIYSYSLLNNTIELLMKDFGVNANNIMQDEAGKFIYVLGNDNFLFILDLE